jgi:hypothetical protein
MLSELERRNHEGTINKVAELYNQTKTSYRHLSYGKEMKAKNEPRMELTN